MAGNELAGLMGFQAKPTKLSKAQALKQSGNKNILAYFDEEAAPAAGLLIGSGGGGEAAGVVTSMAAQSSPAPGGFATNGKTFDSMFGALREVNRVRDEEMGLTYQAKPITGLSRGASRIKGRHRILGGRSGGFG